MIAVHLLVICNNRCDAVVDWYGKSEKAQAAVYMCIEFVGSVKTHACSAIRSFFNGVKQDISKNSTDSSQNFIKK